jgi:hypothetical protein
MGDIAREIRPILGKTDDEAPFAIMCVHAIDKRL